MKKRIRIQGALVVFSVVSLLILYNLIAPRWQDEELDELLDIAGIGLVFFGFLFRISSRGYKEQGSLSGHKLVTSGPYALMRNPMYFGTLLIGSGVVTVLATWWALLFFLFVFSLIYVPQIRKEKEVLLKAFGEEYRSYCKKTPLFFPRLKFILSPAKYLPLRVSWIKKEWLPLAITLGGIMIIEVFHDYRLFGNKEILGEAKELFLAVGFFAVFIFLVFKERNNINKRMA